MKEVRRVLYVGDDTDYIIEGIRYFQHISTKALAYEYNTIQPSKDLALFPLLKNKDCLLVILDFTHHDVNFNHLMNQLKHLKNHVSLKQVAFVGLFKDKIDLIDSRISFMYGLTYLHIKGNERTQFMKDCAYVAYDSSIEIEYYAQVKNLSLPSQLSMLAYVSEMSAEGFKLSCDLDETTEEIKLSHSFSGNLMTHIFPVDKNYPGAAVGNFLTSFDILFPYLNHWEATEDDLQKEKVESWMAKSTLLQNHDRQILLWTTQDDLFGQFMQLELPNGYSLHLNQSVPILKVQTIRPDIIVLDLNLEQDILHDLMPLINNSGKEPALIILNSPFESEELKNNLKYEKLISYNSPCDFKIVDSLIKLYLAKISSSPNDDQLKSFCDTDLNAHVSLDVPMIVTSLTEHEITFYHKSQLAMFSTLKLDVPVTCYVLIIPSYWELDKKENYHHHMGIIMGLDNEDSIQIRTFVNQAIFTPLTSFEKPLKKSLVELQLTPENEISIPEDPKPHIVEKKKSNSRRGSFLKSKL